MCRSTPWLTSCQQHRLAYLQGWTGASAGAGHGHGRRHVGRCQHSAGHPAGAHGAVKGPQTCEHLLQTRNVRLDSMHRFNQVSIAGTSAALQLNAGRCACCATPVRPAMLQDSHDRSASDLRPCSCSRMSSWCDTRALAVAAHQPRAGPVHGPGHQRAATEGGGRDARRRGVPAIRLCAAGGAGVPEIRTGGAALWWVLLS